MKTPLFPGWRKEAILGHATSTKSIFFQNGDTSLHISAAMGRRKLTRVLLESGCDREMKNKQG